MVFWIFLGTMLFTIIVTYFSASFIGTINNNMIFGVTLPRDVIKDSVVLGIMDEYKKQLNLISLCSLISVFVMFFIRDSLTLSLTYLMFWFIAATYGYHIPYKNENSKLAKVKRENNWFVGEKKVVSIDTKVSSLKSTMVIKPYWFILPIAISLLMIVSSKAEETGLLSVMGWISLITTFIFYGAYSLLTKMKTKAYSENSDINLAANKVYKGYWSILWVFLAIYQAMVSYLTYWLVSFVETTTYIAIVMSFGIIPIVAILLVTIKIKGIINDLIELSEKNEIITDEDDNWIYGIFYHNSNDKSVMVEKRFGIGMTFNMATSTGKFFTYGSIVLFLVIFTSIILFTGISDVLGHSLHIAENREVQIKTIFYGHNFSLDEVQEIKLIETMPSSFRTNGASTSNYSRGNFTVRGYGRSKLYIFNNNPPYIVIKLEDIHVFYNEKDPDETLKLYELLLEKVR